MEHVILLHGIGANSRTLKLIEKHIKRAGYKTHNWDYSVKEKSLHDVIQEIRYKVNNKFKQDDVVHFVGHSLGGVISRGVMAFGLDCKMGYLITMGSPHKGAVMAKLFPFGKLLFKGVFGRKIVQDLVHKSTVYNLPYPDTKIGTISGDKRIHPGDPVSWITSKLMKEPHDGFISVKSTQIEDIAEGIILDVDHCYMIFDREVIRQVIYFLNNGEFSNVYKE